MASYYNVLTTSVIVASSSGSGYYPLGGIKARYLTIENYSAKPLWVALDACSTAISTADIIITSCEDVRSRSFSFGDTWSYVQKVTIGTTSTTDVPQFSIYASDGTSITR